jgi:hypothetical protein
MGTSYVPAIQAAALGQLGRHEEARKAVQDLLALRPDFAAAARQEYAKWYDEEHVEQVIDGLRKAGLEIADPQRTAPASSCAGDSTEGRPERSWNQISTEMRIGKGTAQRAIRRAEREQYAALPGPVLGSMLARTPPRRRSSGTSGDGYQF